MRHALAAAAAVALAVAASPASANHEKRAGCTLQAAGTGTFTGVVTAAVAASDEAAEAHAVHCAVVVGADAWPAVYANWDQPVAAEAVRFTAGAGDTVRLCQETISPFGSWQTCVPAVVAGVLPSPAVVAATTW